MNNISVFFDANVYFSGTLNPYGGSGYILALAQSGRYFRLTASSYVIGEAFVNLEKKVTTHEVRSFMLYLQGTEITFYNPTEGNNELQAVLNFKDARVLQAAIDAGAKYFVTLDRKHFFTREVVEYAQTRGLSIVTSKEFIENFIKQLRNNKSK